MYHSSFKRFFRLARYYKFVIKAVRSSYKAQSAALRLQTKDDKL